MGSRNAEGVGGVVGLKARTTLKGKDGKEKTIISIDDFAKAREKIPYLTAFDSQADPLLRLPFGEVVGPYISARSEQIHKDFTGIWSSKTTKNLRESDWSFKVKRTGNREFKVSVYLPGARNADAVFTVQYGTTTVKGVKMQAIKVQRPDGRWITFGRGKDGWKLLSDGKGKSGDNE